MLLTMHILLDSLAPAEKRPRRARALSKFCFVLCVVIAAALTWGCAFERRDGVAHRVAGFFSNYHHSRRHWRWCLEQISGAPSILLLEGGRAKDPAEAIGCPSEIFSTGWLVCALWCVSSTDRQQITTNLEKHGRD